MASPIVRRKSEKFKKSSRRSVQPELLPFVDALAELLVEDALRPDPDVKLQDAPWRKKK